MADQQEHNYPTSNPSPKSQDKESIQELEIKLELDRQIKPEPEFLADPNKLKSLPLPPAIQELLQHHPVRKFEYQRDTYWDNREFSLKEAGEALRKREVRRFTLEEIGLWQEQKQQSLITYKGAKESNPYKLRDELEFAPSPELWDLLPRLRFFPTMEVAKGRWSCHLAATQKFAHQITVSLDWVAQLGLYLEVEVVAPKSHIQQAHTGIRDFLHHWRLEGFAVEEQPYISLVAGLA